MRRSWPRAAATCRPSDTRSTNFSARSSSFPAARVAGALAVTAVLLGGVLSSAAYVRTWHQDNPGEAYLQTARETLAGRGSLDLADQVVPPRVVPGYQFPANTTLRLLRVEPKDEISSAFTREEVAALVEESRGEGLIEADEYDRLAGALLAGTIDASWYMLVATAIAGTPLLDALRRHAQGIDRAVGSVLLLLAGALLLSLA